MEIHPLKRKVWSERQKLAFVTFLDMPDRNGKFKTIREFASEYAVTAKTLYQWKKLYQLKDSEISNGASRKSSNSKSNNLELQEEIFKIALLNPIFSTREIIQNLSAAHRRVTVPTVQKILKIRDLNTLKKRSIATEYEYVKKHLAISKSTLDYLTKKNPYLDLLQINAQIVGCLFYLKCLDLSNLYGAGAGYLLLAVDTKSLTTFSQVWDGKYLDVPVTFINNISKIFGKNGEENYFETEENDIFRDLKNNRASNKINWFDAAQYYFSRDHFEIALSEVLKLIQTKFLKTYAFTSVEKLQVDLEGFLLMRRTTDGPLGYPTFGQSPYHLNKR